MTRILCVNDTPAARYVFTRVLRSAGYEVIEGATAAEALRLVREEKPDLLLLDVNLRTAMAATSAPPSAPTNSWHTFRWFCRPPRRSQALTGFSA